MHSTVSFAQCTNHCKIECCLVSSLRSSKDRANMFVEIVAVKEVEEQGGNVNEDGNDDRMNERMKVERSTKET